MNSFASAPGGTDSLAEMMAQLDQQMAAPVRKVAASLPQLLVRSGFIVVLQSSQLARPCCVHPVCNLASLTDPGLASSRSRGLASARLDLRLGSADAESGAPVLAQREAWEQLPTPSQVVSAGDWQPLTPKSSAQSPLRSQHSRQSSWAGARYCRILSGIQVDCN